MALGLYVGRLSAELIRPGLAIALLLTLAAVAVSLIVQHLKSARYTWPFLILLLYVLYPEPDPRFALAVGGATIIALLQTANRAKRFAAVSKRTADFLTGLILVLVAFTLYVNTLSPDILPADSGELQLVGATWGVAHPTGFPLYTILANMATRLPFGPSPAFRANLFSALTSTATLLFLHLAVYKLTGKRVAGLIAASALGTSTTFWSQATTANVRSLTALFTVSLFYLALLLRDSRSQLTSSQTSKPPHGEISSIMRRANLFRLQLLFVFVLVLAVTHHTSLLFIGGLLALYAVTVQPSLIREPTRWPFLLLAGLTALLPLLYLPIRGAAGALGAPDELDTLNGFINHMLGLGFRGDLFFFDTITVLWERLMVMANVLTFQFALAGLVVMLLGLVFLFRKDRLLAFFLAASIAVHTVVAAVYRAPQTVEYMLPTYVLLAVLFGYAGGYFNNIQVQGHERSLRTRTIKYGAILFLTAMSMIVITQATQNYGSFRALAGLTSARDYAHPVLQDAPADAVVLADWHWVTPFWYLQEVETLRPDIEVRFVFPESGPYAETWAQQIADELANGRPVVATHFDASAYDQLPLAEPFHQAFLFRQEPLLTLPAGYTRLDGELGPGLAAEGMQQSSDEIMPGQELIVDLVWRGSGQADSQRSLYAHLIGEDGRLYAGDDQLAKARPTGLTINRFGLTPLLHTPPGNYELIVGSYGNSTTEPLYAVSMAQIEVRAAISQPVTTNHVFRSLLDSQNERTLIGYDWDSTLPGRQRLYLHWSTTDGFETQSVDVDGGHYTMPAWFGPWGVEMAGASFEPHRPSAYIPLGQGLVWLGQSRDESQSFLPGESVKLKQEFTSARPVLSDLVVSLRLVGYQDDSRTWAWWDLDDGIPAMGAIPTLKWISGSRVSHPVFPTVSPDAQPNQQSEPLLLLYDAFTSRRLPILDERITQVAPWIPVGLVPVDPDS